ncbi:SWIRM domain-containing protein [Nemania abortiva]|nr:SWIRM domain-containing protein [Nemania abortiva]
MASTSPQLLEPRKPCDINNLMSPPEPPKFESFGQHSTSTNSNSNSNMSGIDDRVAKSANVAMANVRRLPGPMPPLSPPISPATKLDDNVMEIVVTAPQDPILYPANDIAHSPPPQPLFVSEEPIDAGRIDKHISTRSAEFFKDATPPKRDEYELVLYFTSQVMKKCMENPRAWLKRERDLLIADRQAQARHRQFRLHPILPAKPQPIRREVQRAKPSRAPRVTKPVVAKTTPTKPRPIRAGPSPATASTVTGAVAAGLTKPIARPTNSTPDPSPRRGTTQTRADDDFNSVPDFCPPLESIPQNGFTSLKMEWKTGMTDLSNDPHRHLLHKEEITLASSLRLTAAVYLTSKRRIFARRLECLRQGKEFRKTDAQQACKIDVNKASKLWTAFDRINWLDKDWVKNYL